MKIYLKKLNVRNMIAPIEFFIGITDGEKSIQAIHIKLDHSMSVAQFKDLTYFLKTYTALLVSDINASKFGSPSFNRIKIKIQELADMLTTEVVMDLNLEQYVVDVDYEEIGIPVPLENPVLVIDFFQNNHKRIYSDEFNTVLYDSLICASG